MRSFRLLMLVVPGGREISLGRRFKFIQGLLTFVMIIFGVSDV